MKKTKEADEEDQEVTMIVLSLVLGGLSGSLNLLSLFLS
jgi:hypothetical protein